MIGSLYKIIAKILARRMMEVMEKIIGIEQSTFIKGRSIMDGVVILNEVINEAKKAKEGRWIFKVDFAKAYDTVEWGYLLEMMKAMNFLTKWIAWIKECISTASASVLVNGSPSEKFRLERGIRRSDPLSPFLFLVVTEGLNALTRKAE